MNTAGALDAELDDEDDVLKVLVVKLAALATTGVARKLLNPAKRAGRNTSVNAGDSGKTPAFANSLICVKPKVSGQVCPGPIASEKVKLNVLG